MTAQKSESGTRQDVLTVRDLKVTFHTYAGDVKALDGVELSLRRKELLGLVGESGCGKSVTSLSIVGLLPPNAEIISGEVLLDGTNLLKMKREDLRLMRLKDIAMVFQDPMTYLNPVLTIGSQITEIIASKPELFVQELIRDRLQELEKLDSASGLEGEMKNERDRL